MLGFIDYYAMESLAFWIHSSTGKSRLLILFSAILLQFGQATDTIVSTQDVSVGQTITSAGRTFELGFFSPANSSRRYVGIWYREIPHTVVWVANREKPLSTSDRYARLKIGTDGNLRILDGKQGEVWSTNISSQLNNSIAMLSDTGNFILKDNVSGWNAWESFRYPSDVLLTSMQLGLNTKTGQKQFLNSWRSISDPSTGNFTAGLLPVAPVECLVWNGVSIHWRSGPWNGIRFVGVPYQGPSYLNDWSLQQNNQSGALYLGTNQYDNPYIRITRLTPDGSMKTMQWTGKEWNVTWDWESSQNPCDVYGACGSFGMCSAKGSPVCRCLEGYTPKSPEDWSKGNWTDGCVRQTEFLCSKNVSSSSNAKQQKDVFLKLSRMKLPYKYDLLSSEEDPQGCQDWCLHNCSCTAYSYVTGIGCLVWRGNLIDLQLFPYSGQDLFIRLAHIDQAKNNKRAVIISLTVALVIIAILLFTYIICRSRLKNEGGSRSTPVTHVFWKDSIKSSSDMSSMVWRNGLNQGSGELPTLDLQIILEATNGFSERNKIGEGGFGAVFKGKLQDGQEIAVKRLSSCSRQGMDEFRNEILLISKLQHKNLVKILGCSVQGEEKLLLYEYLPNRSLDTYLFDDAKKKQLDWGTRSSIIKGIARGMSYLHQDSRLRVIHRDLKASNILLDDDMNPKISDFGLARIFETAQASANTVRVAGTFGYMSPEYAMRGIISEKSDVFSFGVLMLEIISGKKSSSLLFGYHDLSLVDYAWKLWIEGRGLDMVDESLVELSSDIEVWRCIHIALLCVQDLADDRPTMPTVVLMLGSETPLPDPKQPTYVPQTPSSYGPSHPSDNGSCSTNEITISQIEGR